MVLICLGFHKTTADLDAQQRLRIETGATVATNNGDPEIVEKIDFNGNPYEATTGRGELAAVHHFLNEYQDALGIEDFTEELTLSNVIRDAAAANKQQATFGTATSASCPCGCGSGGRPGTTLSTAHVNFVQQCAGIPVFGAEVRFHLNDRNQITWINSAVSPNVKCGAGFDPTPSIEPDAAANVAIAYIREQRSIPAEVALGLKTAPKLVLLDRGLLRPSQAAQLKQVAQLSYLTNVVLTDDKHHNSNASTLTVGVDETVLVGAHTGTVLESFSNIADSLFRRIWLRSVGQPGTEVWAEGDPFPTIIPEVNNLVVSTKHAYDAFMNIGNFDSYDNHGAPMVSVAQLESADCPNAFWDGEKTNFCPGAACDDVIVHEWTHAYTENTHGLLYIDQSGALNEAWSDIFGVPVAEYHTADARLKELRQTKRSSTGDGCPFVVGGEESSLRWVVASSCSAFRRGLGLRDMYNPNCYNNPGKTSDELYFCSPQDNGGVHFNSGVPNHAFALMVDGGTYNGVTIKGICAAKALQFYWRAMRVYQTPTTTFSQHADAIIRSCNDLCAMGQRLPNPFTGARDVVITNFDCTQASLAMDAVEMRGPVCGAARSDVLLPGAPALCFRQDDGDNSSSVIFYEDFETEQSAARWSVTYQSVFPDLLDQPLPWRRVVISEAIPQFGANNGIAFYAPDTNNTDCDENDQSGVTYLTSPKIQIPSVLPSGSTQVKLAFEQTIFSELKYDGGVLYISINSGPFELVPTGAFTFNGPNVQLDAVTPGVNNPLKGLWAWSGLPNSGLAHLYNTQAILYDQDEEGSQLLRPGDTIELRWAYGIDGCTGYFGWLVDTIRVYTC